MNYEIKDYSGLQESFDKLDIQSDGLLCFLPENLFDTENTKNFIYSETTIELNKAFKNKIQKIDYLTDDKPLLRSRKSADWFGPTIFIGYTILAESPQLVDISMNLLSSYLYDLFKGTSGNKKVKFDIVIGNEKKKSYKKISYEGNVEGVKELIGIIKNFKK